MAQPAGLSVRPTMVKRSCTPPSALPFPFLMNRASRTGPLDVMKEGTVSRRYSRSTGELRIDCRAASSQCRLDVAASARIQVEPRAQPIGNGLHLRELRYSVISEKIEFTRCKTADRCARASGAGTRTGIGLRKTTCCREQRT